MVANCMCIFCKLFTQHKLFMFLLNNVEKKVYICCAPATFQCQVDKHLLVALLGAGVALVAALVLHLDPPQQQRRVALQDVCVEEAGASAEVLVLQAELVLVVVVAVHGRLLLVPVDDHRATRTETARQDAVLVHGARHIGLWGEGGREGHVVRGRVQSTSANLLKHSGKIDEGLI